MANVIVRITEDEKRSLKIIAKEKNTDISLYIKSLVDKELKNYQLKEKFGSNA